MSLREFHILFITASLFLCLGFSYWAVVQYQHLHERIYAAASFLSFLGAVGLALYEIYFVRKTGSPNGR